MKYDVRFPTVVLALLVIGLMTVSTAALSPRAPSGIFVKQIAGVFLAAVPIGVMWWAGRDRIYKFAPYLYGLALLMQASTFVIGKEVNGQRNWISLGPLQFQPLEILKFTLILMLALTLRAGYRGLPTYARALAVFLPAVGLVVLQDFGGAMVLSVMFGLMLLAARIPWWHAALAVLAVAVAVPTVMYPHLEPYQQKRLTIFLDPYQDPRGAGYQVIQSTIAVGSGGVQGKGYQQGTQSHNGFLPEAQTDFAFSTWAEEQGLVGGAAVLALYGFLLWGLAGMAAESPRLQDQILFAGVLAQIGFQVLENIGAALSVLPLTGITLPLISYGLSSLVSTLSTLGLAYVVYRDRYDGSI
ncbi:MULTISPECIES: FtsW/RodA/SpoVE family cell cycle protein [Deinococcus]|uniref:Rod shape-determining protein RodA n=2 Tax=Deinococcus TaxID=1298 RepID=A0A221STS1_9DEIO|nr:MULTISPECIES: FtsW/RodA/SpoVE family cell cycle protein [Deinococcus]ASN80035.1 rod shape-determining protein RodA [Deinococcus ficus]MDP9764691.1 rod shape determining protein RodA [Deinococcus enclensis]GHF80509.1 rod shape-determining protein RodA [Deinococcus ficus]